MRQLALKDRAHPSDLNPAGTVFGGWVMAQMDKAASIAVDEIVYSNIVTVSVSNLHFKKPVRSGDIVTIYTTIKKIGRTSIIIHVEMDVKHHVSNREYPVTDGEFKFVTVDENGYPIPVRDVLKKNIDESIKELI